MQAAPLHRNRRSQLLRCAVVEFDAEGCCAAPVRILGRSCLQTAFATACHVATGNHGKQLRDCLPLQVATDLLMALTLASAGPDRHKPAGITKFVFFFLLTLSNDDRL